MKGAISLIDFGDAPKVPACTPKFTAGLTLIELLVVIAIFSMVAGLGLGMSVDALKGYIFRSEQATVIALLEKARVSAMTNREQSPYGLCFDLGSASYILFRGAAFAASQSNNESVPEGPSVTIDSNPPIFFCSSGGIIFEQLTGNSSTVDITLTEGARTATIAIINNGRIE